MTEERKLKEHNDEIFLYIAPFRDSRNYLNRKILEEFFARASQFIRGTYV